MEFLIFLESSKKTSQENIDSLSMKRMFPIVSVIVFILSLVCLGLYSYTQIDLGLSLSRFESWHQIQRGFQEIGYFNRPLSSLIYIGIISFMSISYLFLLYALSRKMISLQTVWVMSLVSAGILFLSYNAFSYDLFNYIFDAKIITEYGDNPYVKKALDYPDDSMLGFMRWTHRVYPYGPVWLLFSVPLSFGAMGSLILNIVLFKGLAVLSYLLLVRFLMDFAKKIKVETSGFHVGLFALNPLVIIESLVSAHNDIIMMCLLLGAFVLYSNKRFISSVGLYGLSVGIKFATGFLFPVFVYLLIKKGVVSHWQNIITMSFICMLGAVLAASSRTQFQPWYLLYILPFAALSNRQSIRIPTITISLFALLQYLPYIYLGNYDPPVLLVQASMVSISCVVSAVIACGVYLYQTIRSS